MKQQLFRKYCLYRLIPLLLFILFINNISAQNDSQLWLRLFPTSKINYDSLTEITAPTNTGSLFKTVDQQKNISIYTISSKIISRANYNTLVDILKDQATFFTNQPGSALQGEIFYSNGICGNENYQIQINGINVMPSGSFGFPIANNLPIRQASKIEIIQQPSSALYGQSASAGVINIITPQTERPIYLKASLAGLSGYYKNLNLLVGGKFGKAKNTVRFDIFGGFHQYADFQLLNSDTTIYSIWQYQNKVYPLKSNTNFQQIPPDYGPVEHSSDLNGFNFYFRNFHFMYTLWNRKDIASNGLHQLSGYKDFPNFFSSDKSKTFTALYEKQNSRGKKQIQLQFIGYKLANRSANKYIFPAVKGSALDYIHFNGLKNTPPDSIPTTMAKYLGYLDKRYFDGVRFTFAFSYDIHFHYLWERIRKNFKWQYGVNYDLNILTSIGTFFNRNTLKGSGLIDGLQASAVGTIEIDSMPGFIINTFSYQGNIEYKLGKFTFQLNNRISIPSLLFNIYYFQNIYYTPNLNIKIQTKLKKPVLINYSRGIQYFNPNRIAQQYFYEINTDNKEIHIYRNTTKQAPLVQNKVSISNNPIQIFWMKTTGIPIYGYLNKDGTFSAIAGQNMKGVGYFASQEFSQSQIGFTIQADNLNRIFDYETNLEKFKNRIYVFTSAWFQFAKQFNKFPEIQKNEILFNPTTKSRVGLNFSSESKWRFAIFHNSQGKVRPSYSNNLTISGNSWFDLLFIYNFNRQFTAQIRYNNIFRKDIYGAQATGTPDDTRLQPQRLEKVFITLNYALE